MRLEDFSPHPEWDRMYAAGLSTARIAELVGAPASTVRGHLERRRAADPTLAARHNSAPSTTSDHWRGRLIALRDFMAKHGRYPAIHGTEVGERQLYGWLAAQRHALVAHTMTWEQAREMGILGDWVSTARERALDAHWRSRLAAVVDFISENGRLPRPRPKRPPEEHSLSLWLQTQRHDTLHGRILQWRREALDEALPGWRRARGGA